MKEKITINCQSSIKITNDQIIYFDPYKISEENHDADIIFITHDHYDHYDVESIKKVMKDSTKIVIPDMMAPKVLENFSANNVVGVLPNEIYSINGLEVETIPSYNTNKNFHPKSNNWVGYILTINNERIYVAGDTDITEENKKVKCDIALVPIGGTYTMTSSEAAELINIIRPKTVIPTHYITVVGSRKDEENFISLIDNGIECKVLIDE